MPLQSKTLHVRFVKEKYYLTVCAYNVTNACITSIAHALWLPTKNITIPQLGLVLHVEMSLPFSVSYWRRITKYSFTFWWSILLGILVLWIVFANNIFNPFELNDIDSTQPNYEIDPDFHYFNDVNISNMLKCNYHVSESFGKLLKSRAPRTSFLLCTIIFEVYQQFEWIKHISNGNKREFQHYGMSETWLKEDNVDLYGVYGYAGYHNVRHYRRGGGVCLSVKNNITCNRRDDLSFCYDYVDLFS